MKQYIIAFLSGVLLTLIVFLWIGHGETSTVTETDTVVVWKTDTVPVVKDSLIVRYQSVILPTVVSDTDSVFIHDSVRVEVPITQKRYSDDSTYTAYVSGFMPNLDSISVATREVRSTVTVKRKWGVGINAGYGITPKGTLTPYIGFGFSYTIL